MALDRDQLDNLRAEAKRIRRNFRYIQSDLKRAPENIDLLRQRDALKKRYTQIQEEIHQIREREKELPEASGHDAAEHAVDMSQFEPQPFAIPSATDNTPRTSATAGGKRTRFTVTDFRTAISVVLLVLVVPFFYLYFVKGMRFYEVSAQSMEPALIPGDRVVALRPALYERGDIVIVPDAENPGDYLVKRLVAFGGDTVEIANGTLFVNGQPIDEPYLKEGMNRQLKPTRVPEGEVYLLGDNRNLSGDSRTFGGTSARVLAGRARYIYSPPGRRGMLRDETSAFAEVRSPQ